MNRLSNHKKGFPRCSRMAFISCLTIAGLSFILIAGSGPVLSQSSTLRSINGSSSGGYVVIGWNDLGMHCINSSYAELALLPPFNNLWAQVIRRGNPPKVVTSGIRLEYSIISNRTVEDKTDFWQYVGQLFGVNLPLGIGLTGNGLSGQMQLVGDHFEATGIPVLPYDDRMNWNPYQAALIKLKTDRGHQLKTTKVTIPVSDDIHCDMCHMQGGDGTVNLPVDPDTGLSGTMNVNLNILMTHDYYHGQNGTTTTGPNLVDSQPVLCANCHSSNALGPWGVGDGASKSVSLAMHGWHNGVDRAADATCYSCHPGEQTQCLRTGIGGMGYTGTVPSCQSGLCHGGISGMGDPARTPWVTEPNCEQCHGVNYSTGGNLYRHSTGHGGIYCAACHNSPHAWWPSKLSKDNLQPMKLQQAPYAIANCKVCHTKKQTGDNPHVIYYPVTK